jgi:glycosyltransferase involved in cell wall biosynthesis
VGAEEPAIFHAHLSWPLACKYPLIAAALLRSPAVVASVQLYFDITDRWELRHQPRLLSPAVDLYLAVSEGVAGELRERLGIPGSKIRVLHNAIPVRRFAGADGGELRRMTGWPPDRPLALSVARLHSQKGLGSLVEAAARLPQVGFVVVGEGPERPTLEARIRELGVGDRFFLPGSRADVPELLAGCDVFVLPSLYEGLPLSILEAMAAGRPVIASAIPGNDEALVHEESGLLVPPGDAVALANAISKVVSSPELGTRLGEAARKRVSRCFSTGAMVQRLVGIYEELVQ